MLQPGNKIGITACSNGQKKEGEKILLALENTLQKMGLKTVLSPYIYAREGAFSGSGRERARALMNFYKDPEIQMISDISGGDLGNEVLSYLDFSVIKQYPKPFWGYSDLTTLLNAIYAQTGQEGYLYQVRHLVGPDGARQQEWFKASVLEGKEDLFQFKYDFMQGDNMEGIVVGGNIRCFLKLAGTPFMPSLKGKILLLEAMSGETPQIMTYLHQLKQLNAFREIKGILLGTFTMMTQHQCTPTLQQCLKEVIEDSTLPIAKTCEIGHGSDSKAIVIGGKIKLDKTRGEHPSK